MVKTDRHMEKVKGRLLAEKRKTEEAEERRNSRENKKLAKEIQAQKQRDRAKQKKEDIESVKKWRKQRQQSGFAKDDNDGDLSLAFEDEKSFERSNKKRPGVSPGDRSGGKAKIGGGKMEFNKRKGKEFKDAKFGFGGKKGMKKQNTEDSTNDFRDFSKSTSPDQRDRKGGGIHGKRKLRLLCLHGFRTSGEIIRKQVTGKWPEPVLENLDLVCVDAPFPCQGKSDVEGIFDPPYFEWFQFNKEFSEYQNFDECLAYIEECMIKHGPCLLGFSQGAILSAALPGLQANGVCLTKVPKIKFVVIIGGAKFRNPSVVEKAYSSLIQCPSVHFLGNRHVKIRGITILKILDFGSFTFLLITTFPYSGTMPDPKWLGGTISSFATFFEVQPFELLQLFSMIS